MNVTVPLEVLDSVTVRLASVVFGLLYWSCRCTVMLPEATPAVTVTGALVNTSWVAAPALTVAMAAEPVSPSPSLTVTVKLFPATVGVTLKPLNTPEVNGPDEPVTPAVPPNVTGPVKLVTVLLFTSCAVIVMAKAVPAVWGDSIAEIAKWSRGPGGVPPEVSETSTPME